MWSDLYSLPIVDAMGFVHYSVGPFWTAGMNAMDRRWNKENQLRVCERDERMLVLCMTGAFECARVCVCVLS